MGLKDPDIRITNLKHLRCLPHSFFVIVRVIDKHLYAIKKANFLESAPYEHLEPDNL